MSKAERAKNVKLAQESVENNKDSVTVKTGKILESFGSTSSPMFDFKFKQDEHAIYSELELKADPEGMWIDSLHGADILSLEDRDGNIKLKFYDGQIIELDLGKLADIVTAAQALHRLSGGNVFNDKHIKIRKVKADYLKKG